MKKLITKVDASASYDKNCPYFFVMDNAMIHRNPDLKEIIEKSPHNIKLLSPYSPFLNPIEEGFSKLKWSVKARFKERGREKLIKRIKQGTEEISNSDCQGWVRHATQFFAPCIREEKDL